MTDDATVARLVDEIEAADDFQQIFSFIDERLGELIDTALADTDDAAEAVALYAGLVRRVISYLDGEIEGRQEVADDDAYCERVFGETE